MMGCIQISMAAPGSARPWVQPRWRLWAVSATPSCLPAWTLTALVSNGVISGGGATGRNGEKIHGPWFLYFNTGATPEAIIADAKVVAASQKKKWPYGWMEEPMYPVKSPLGV